MALSLISKKLHRLSGSRRQIYRRYCASSNERKGLVLGVYHDEDCQGLELTPSAEKFNQNCQGKLVEQIKLAGNKVKAGKSFVFWGLDKEFHSVAVVGLGKKAKTYDDIELICEEKDSVRIAAAAGCKALDAAGVKDIHVEGFGDPESSAEGAKLGTFKFQEYKTKPETIPTVTPYDLDCAKWELGCLKADAQNLVRRLGDTPANLLTPSLFSETACDLVKNLDIDIEIRDKEWAEKEKMNAFLAVAKGSCEPPKFVELTYKNSDAPPFVLVGKGVTFDSGGISLKPGRSMDAMRGDMLGGACVLSVVRAIAALKMPVHVKGLIPLVENLPSGSAFKPGDVVRARNGKSICVDNTDAEGRLILADALAYSAVFKPAWVLDIATLTGAMVIALGGSATGVFTNSNKLYQILENAGSKSGDRVWRMPLWKCFSKKMTGYDAYDLNNIGKGGGGGSCTAAAFLKEFVPEKTDWLHLDIAGTANLDKSCEIPYLSSSTMTGRPTRTLIEFMEAQVKC